jgi:hypothetical protein
VGEQQDDRPVVVVVAEAALEPTHTHPTGVSVAVLVPLVVLGALPLILLRFGTQPISDPDTLWHILAGRRLSESWQFAGPDQLATFAQLPFVYHQWLPELLMAAANAVGGLPGVAWLFQLMLLGFLLATYALCRSQAGILAAVLASVAAWVGAGGSLSPRPQVVGFILLALSLAAWLRTENDGRLRWWLVPLTFLWACVHGTWVYAVALAVVFSIGLLLDRRFERHQVSRLALLLGSLLFVGLVTPVGPRLLLTPVAIAQISPFIMEWKSTPITDPSAATTLLMGLVVMVIWVRSPGRTSWTQLLLWLFAMGSTLMYGRTIAIGAILVAPLFAKAIQRALPKRPVARRLERRVIVVTSLTALILAAIIAPATAANPAKVPSGFDTYLSALPNGTVVWNVDALGGWLLYEHPNLRATMDTRAEVYGREYVQAYVRAISGYPGWQDTVTKTGARYAIVNEDGPLQAALVEAAGWHEVQRSEKYVLLAAR